MKILKIFGIVAGIHLFALVVIFANPGCSSTAKRPPQPADTAAPVITAAPAGTPSASASPYYTSGGAEPGAPSSVNFSPETPASSSGSTTAPDIRFTPTRPGTPVAGTLATEAVGDVTPVSTHTVQAGDNLGGIARKHGVTIAQLTAANNLTTKSTLKVGQKLIVPAKVAPVAVAPKGKAAAEKAETIAPKPTTSSGIKHVVKTGESLGVIARNYGVKAGDIAVANHISDPAKIRAGMELIIPGWQATGEKGGASKKSSTTKAASSTASAPAPASRASQSTPAPMPAPLEPAPVIDRAAPPAQVPVIRIDEGQITAAPKS